VTQRVRQLAHPLRAFARRRQSTREALPQIPAGHEIHCEVRLTIARAHRVYRDDIRMTEPGGGLAFADETLRQTAIRVRRDEFERDEPIQPLLACEPDDRCGAEAHL